MHNQLKIIFVAFGENSLGRSILKMILNQKMIPEYVFMGSNEAFKQFRKNGIRRYFNNNGLFNTLWRIYYRLTLRKDLKNDALKKDSSLKKSIKEICFDNNIPLGYFDNINDPQFVNILKELKPDIIVLGGAPLLKEAVIDIPRIGVLNSHPGVLPDAKGMDVVAHSLLNDIPLGATVFKVDKGIDSGPILLTKYLETDIKDKKLNEIETMVEEISANAMIEGINKIATSEYNFVPQSHKGKIYKALTYKTYKKVVDKLNNL